MLPTTRLGALLVAGSLGSFPALAQRAPAGPTRTGPVAITATRCLVGGTMPAYFIELPFHATQAITGLTATRFELRSASGTWVSGTAGPIILREFRGMTAGGAFDVRPFHGTLPGNARMNLQASGTLAMAAYGSGVDYPNAALAFRVHLQDDLGRAWDVTGEPCVVGPAG